MPCTKAASCSTTHAFLIDLLAREGINIPSTSFAVSTSIADPPVSFYDIEIQGDSYLDPVPTSKLEARKMTGNPSDTQKGNTLVLCHAILPPSER